MSEKQPKIRSTCDACQAAKLRCSRDKPRCRRCQNLNRDCVYSVSRPLGRPRRTPAGSRDSAAQSDDSATHGRASPAAHTPLGQPPSPSLCGSPLHISPNEDVPDSMLWEAPLVADGHLDFSSALHGFDCSSFLDPVPNTSAHTGGSLPDLTASSWGADSTLGGYPELHGATHRSEATPERSPSHAASVDFNCLDIPPPPTQPLALDIEPMLLTPVSDMESLNSYHSPFDTSLSSFAPTSAPSIDLPDLGSGNLDCGCTCYPTVLRRMYTLSSSRMREEVSTTDQTMKLEKEIREEIVQVLQCSSCEDNRQRILLFIGVIVETTVDLLENVFMEELGASRKSLFNGVNDAMQHSRKRSKSDPYRENTTLRIGTYEIDGDEKRGFLSYLIRTRLKDLSVTIRQLHTALQHAKQTSTSKAGATVVVEAYQRLHRLMRRLDG